MPSTANGSARNPGKRPAFCLLGAARMKPAKLQEFDTVPALADPKETTDDGHSKRESPIRAVQDNSKTPAPDNTIRSGTPPIEQPAPTAPLHPQNLPAR